MPYYHIYFDYTQKGKRTRGFLYNFQEADVRRSIAIPYMRNRAINLYGRFVHPSDIDKLDIFESELPFHELILPNGKSPINVEDNTYTYRCFCDQKVKGYMKLSTHDFLTSAPEARDLMKFASFLGFNTNWSQATCALQLQEVAMTLVAKRKKIKLDKANVERVLNKKIDTLSFNYQYEAFSRLVKTMFGIEMPHLTTHLRKMRAEVLHEGYNPKPEETESIVSFTIGLLQKLNDINQTT